MGNYLFPAGSVVKDSVAKKLPLVIFLHKYDYSIGYQNRRANEAIKQFVKSGYAVLVFDLIGFGRRITGALRFYNRYPRWSKLGKMVSDTRGMITAAQKMPFIDSSKIYLVGYSLGGTVALFTGAVDKRVKGVAAVAAFSSFKNDNKNTEGIRHYYKLHGLLPKLGFFEGHAQRIPVDFAKILSCIAPRNLLVISPQHDGEHTVSVVNHTMSTVREVYANFNAPLQLHLSEPNTYNHLTNRMIYMIAHWLP